MSIVGSPQWIYNSSTGFYPFEISNSLRFNRSDEAYLSLTPSNNNGGTWTYSTWIKRSRINDSSTLLDASVSGGVYDLLYFPSGNQLRYYNNTSQPGDRMSSAVFRDTAAWYNIIIAVDTSNSTAADRIKVYVNGSQISSFLVTTNFDLNDATRINSNVEHRIGQSIQGGVANLSFGGYMADINFVDGSALGPSSFGELKENIWIPKDTSGLYASAGANSFRLQFKNSSTGSASSSTVGADTSGKNNHFSSTNIASTDRTNDSPTNNHATFNPEIIMMNNATDYRGIGSFSDGNLLLTTDADNESGTVPFGATSGKYYMEFTSVTLGNRQQIMVFSRDDFRGNLGAVTTSSDGSGNATGRQSWTSGDVIGIAVDLDNSKVFIAKNNTYFGSSNPETNTGGDSLSKFTGVGVRHDSGGTNTTTIRFNGGQLAFTYTPPSGFKALSTANLPAPGIDPAEGENPTEHFDTVLYTGTGSTTEISSLSFQPDWLWFKRRSSADNHTNWDSVRGANKVLKPNESGAEGTDTSQLSSFDDDGFTLLSGGDVNQSGVTFAAWCWKAGGTAASNTNGSITSSVSANTKAGISIVSYSGNGSAGATIGHGLSAKPEMFWIKNRDRSAQWSVYHTELGATKFLELSTNAGEASDTPTFNDTEPTATVFSVGTGNGTNASGEDLIAYCFHSVEGYSKFGSYVEHYVSDYDVDSPYVHTGFRPAFLLIKGTSSGRDWVIYDSKRTPDDGVYLTANQNSAEQTDATNHDVSFFSNGFKIRGGSGDINTTGESYIYMAFADQPFKFANGGTE